MSSVTHSSESPEAPRPAARPRDLEIVISWGETVLHLAHLAPPRPFDLGEARPDGRPCDGFLPEQVLGQKRVPLLFRDAQGRTCLALHPDAQGTLTLRGASLTTAAARERHVDSTVDGLEGAVAIPVADLDLLDIHLGDIHIRVTAAQPLDERAFRARPGRRTMGLVALSALAHLGALAAFAMSPTPPPTDDGPTADQVYIMQQYLAAAAERDMEEQETEQVAENNADVKEGGSGTRAKGEEGSLGNPSRNATGNRYGVTGPQDPGALAIARRDSLRDAAEFGMIGLLNTGSGGDPNAPAAPWGRDDSLGNGPTQGGGAAGLGLTGMGESGGGIGLGSIGTIGHGAGAGTGQGFGNGAGHGAGTGAGTGTGQGYGTGHGRLAGKHATPDLSAYAGAPQNSNAPPVHPGAIAEAPLDPNGRFATTYRPGGGHLAAFESAIARGILPEAERVIVSDVGARYAPNLDLPPGKALGLRADLERTALPPSGGAFHLRLGLRSSAEAPSARPHLSVHLVLDTSGSMEGESLERAKQAAKILVDRLDPNDDFSLTTFGSNAEVKVPDGLVGARRQAIQRVIDDLRSSGGTNIGEGLRYGYTQASLPTIPEDAVRVVFLLSDGQASDGITDRGRLSRLALDAFQGGIQTSSFGLGASYDGELMSAIASDGAGGYYYLRDTQQIAPALTSELDRRLDPVASAVEVRVRLKQGVELLRVYGSRRLNETESQSVRTQEIAADVHAQARDKIAANRHEDREGGMRFFMPAFSRDDSHALLFKLRAAPNTATATGTANVGTIELRYKDRIAKKNITEELPLTVHFAQSDAQSAASQDPGVARTVQGFAAGEALTQAALRITRGDRGGATALLEEREGILRQAAETLNEPLFLTDAARLARLRMHTGSSGATSDPLVLAMLLETAAHTHLR
ncbi:vWA domain-containing protein [Chondromyces apiculatus]|uniref:vWA domain-containing protein n=1 Tax=Chondromyces apiculatus TaxID=51 RepID=UPI0009DF4493|nr:VWA domain-containing protein [Chondromyces apiculatus]